MIRPVSVIRRRPRQWLSCFSRNDSTLAYKNPFKLCSEKNFTNETIPLLHRLRTSYDILYQGKKLTVTAKLLAEFYRQENHLLIEDLLCFPEKTDDIFAFLTNVYKNSPSIKVLIINDLVELIRQGKHQHVISFFRILISSGLVPGPVMQELQKVESSSQDGIESILANCIALQALAVPDRIYSTMVVNELEQLGIKLPQSTIERQLLSLTTSSVTKQIYNSYAIMRTLKNHHITGLETNTVFIILSFFLQQKSLFFMNKYFELIVQNQLLHKLSLSNPTVYIDLMVQVVDQNLRYGFFEVAHKYWELIFKQIEEVESKGIDIYVKILKASPNSMWLERSLKLMKHRDISSNEIDDVLIEKLGMTKSTHNEELLQSIISRLESPLRRSTLSSLLRSFLSQNNESATDKVLQLIFKSKDGLEARDLDGLVTKLLKQGKVEQCITMVKATSISISKLAYVTIIRHIFEHEEDLSQRKQFLGDYSIEALKLPKKDESFTLLTTEIIKFYSDRVSNRAAKKMYISINKFNSKPIIYEEDKLYYGFNFEKFAIPNSFKQLIAMDQASRIKSLDLIIAKSVLEQDSCTLLWGIDEMRYNGLDVTDILHHIQVNDTKNFIETIIKPEILQQL